MTSASNVMSFGSTLAQVRKERGITQAQLAKLAGISASAVAMYERGRRTPDAKAMKKLASALRVRMGALMPESQPAAAITGEAPLVTKSANIVTPTAMSPTVMAPTTPPTVSPTHTAAQPGLTQLALSRDEARVILFLRMNPQTTPFIQSYIEANPKRREQLERTWRLIHEFQPGAGQDA